MVLLKKIHKIVIWLKFKFQPNPQILLLYKKLNLKTHSLIKILINIRKIIRMLRIYKQIHQEINEIGILQSLALKINQIFLKPILINTTNTLIKTCPIKTPPFSYKSSNKTSSLVLKNQKTLHKTDQATNIITAEMKEFNVKL